MITKLTTADINRVFGGSNFAGITNNYLWFSEHSWIITEVVGAVALVGLLGLAIYRCYSCIGIIGGTNDLSFGYSVRREELGYMRRRGHFHQNSV